MDSFSNICQIFLIKTELLDWSYKSFTLSKPIYEMQQSLCSGQAEMPAIAGIEKAIFDLFWYKAKFSTIDIYHCQSKKKASK